MDGFTDNRTPKSHLAKAGAAKKEKKRKKSDDVALRHGFYS